MIETLKIISRDRIVAFENSSDEHVSKLAHEMEKEGKLRHPLLVYPLGDKYLLLDDACLVKALESLDIQHIPVQLADYSTLSVHPWQRVVEGWFREDLLKFCESFPRQIHVIETVGGELKRSQAEIRFRDGGTARLDFISDALLVRADIFNKFYAEITRGNRSFRVKLDINDSGLFDLFGKASAAVFPPLFAIDELAHLAARGARLAQGVVRVDQPGRILGIDYALSILQEKAAPEEKESFFKQLIRMRISSDRTAYYNGSVFMFNN